MSKLKSLRRGLLRRVSPKMRDRIGDWLLDVAKYILTAVLITSLVAELNDYRLAIVLISLTFIVLVFVGYILLDSDKLEED